ncbi:hypothetical protein [Streptomyces sp. NPDC003006]
MNRSTDDEPPFVVLDYVTTPRDPKTQLVGAVGGDERAKGILQTVGSFILAARAPQPLPAAPAAHHARRAAAPGRAHQCTRANHRLGNHHGQVACPAG